MIRQMNPREKLFVIGGGAILGLLLVIFGLIVPYRAAVTDFDRSIEDHRQRLQEVRQLRADYLALKQQAERLQREMARGDAPSPLTFLEEIATRLAGRENLVLMRPLPTVDRGALRVETVEFKLERIDLAQALRILGAIENARPPMHVDKLYFRQRFDNTALLDMNATVSATRRN